MKTVDLNACGGKFEFSMSTFDKPSSSCEIFFLLCSTNVSPSLDWSFKVKLYEHHDWKYTICLYLHLWGKGFSFVLRTIIDRCELNLIFTLASSWWLRCHHYYLSINIVVSVIWRRNWYIWGWYRKIHTPLEGFLVCIFMLEEKVSK